MQTLIVENQQHRLVASGIDVPVGMKNPTSGNLIVMLNSITAAQHPHVFSFNGWQVQTQGNPSPTPSCAAVSTITVRTARTITTRI